MADLDALERRIADLNRKVDQASQANASAKTTARLVTVLIVITAVVGVWMLLSPFYEAYQNPEPYKKALTKEMTENVVPTVQQELQKSIETVGPEVGKLVVDQFRNRYEDVLKVVESELTTLLENLRAYTETELSDTVVEIEMEMRGKLTEVLPEIEDPEQRDLIIGNAAISLEGAVKRIIDDKLAKHIQLLSEIETKLLQFPIPTEIKQRTDEELAADLNDVLSQYSIIALRRTLAPEHKEFLRQLAEEETTN